MVSFALFSSHNISILKIVRNGRYINSKISKWWLASKGLVTNLLIGTLSCPPLHLFFKVCKFLCTNSTFWNPSNIQPVACVPDHCIILTSKDVSIVEMTGCFEMVSFVARGRLTYNSPSLVRLVTHCLKTEGRKCCWDGRTAWCLFSYCLVTHNRLSYATSKTVSTIANDTIARNGECRGMTVRRTNPVLSVASFQYQSM
jgi:hypothetical protein